MAANANTARATSPEASSGDDESPHKRRKTAAAGKSHSAKPKRKKIPTCNCSLHSLTLYFSLLQQREKSTGPFDTPTKLSRNPIKRKAQLMEMREQRLSCAFEFMKEMLKYMDATLDFCEQKKFVAVNGDICSERFEIVPLPHARSVKRVFDALETFLANMEISMSEVAGDITVRENDEPQLSINCPVAQHRFVSKIANMIEMDTNNAAFAEYRPPGPGVEEIGFSINDPIDEDELYPYRPATRVRQDVTVIIMVSRQIDKQGKPLIVFSRWWSLRLRKSHIHVPKFVAERIRNGLESVSAAMLEAAERADASSSSSPSNVLLVHREKRDGSRVLVATAAPTASMMMTSLTESKSSDVAISEQLHDDARAQRGPAAIGKQRSAGQGEEPDARAFKSCGGHGRRHTSIASSDCVGYHDATQGEKAEILVRLQEAAGREKEEAGTTASQAEEGEDPHHRVLRPEEVPGYERGLVLGALRGHAPAGANNVKAIVDALGYFVYNIEICISEVLGDITIRENDDPQRNSSIAQHRLVTTIGDRFHMDTNNVAFNEYFPPGPGQSEVGFSISDAVDEDEAFPYHEKERVRQDVTVIIMVQRRQDGTSIIVLARWWCLRIRRFSIDVPHYVVARIQNGMEYVGAAMMAAAQRAGNAMRYLNFVSSSSVHLIPRQAEPHLQQAGLLVSRRLSCNVKSPVAIASQQQLVLVRSATASPRCIEAPQGPEGAQKGAEHLAPGSNVLPTQGDYRYEPVIRLGTNQRERYETLLAMKQQRFQEAVYFLSERSRQMKMNTEFTDLQKFQSDNGDVCLVRFDIKPLPAAHDVMQAFEGVLKFSYNLEISISDLVGDLTIRENDDEDWDSSVAQHRLVTTVKNGIQVDTNNVTFTQYWGDGSGPQPDKSVGNELGIAVCNYVDDDALYPYHKSERVRQDITFFVVVARYPRHRSGMSNTAPAHSMTSVGSPSSSCGSESAASVNESSESQDDMVVALRWTCLRLRKPPFSLDDATASHIRDGMEQVGQAMFTAIHHSVNGQQQIDVVGAAAAAPDGVGWRQVSEIAGRSTTQRIESGVAVSDVLSPQGMVAAAFVGGRLRLMSVLVLLLQEEKEMLEKKLQGLTLQLQHLERRGQFQDEQEEIAARLKQNQELRDSIRGQRIIFANTQSIISEFLVMW
ncbi:unnamed protein product [Phytophthora lilii]|uniref:Unnamed protein product n=1 Tax=Phytophthora lilii TaxID=2077276 RepID=A0A9W6TZX3_9STRA|nr:unnamed protein product [Phytophthora lilii]